MLLVLLVSCVSFLNAVTIDRVILATDANAKYIQFWPIVAQAWQEIAGIRPTLILVAPKSICVDGTLGDVIYFEPLEGLPTSYQAQVIRLFAPLLFPEEICMLSDIDMLPIQGEFYKTSVQSGNDDQLMTFWRYPNCLRYPMTYTVGKGKTFGELFSITWDQVPARLYAWYNDGWGWHTDEMKLVDTIHRWANSRRFNYLNIEVNKRITRIHWANIALDILLDLVSKEEFFDADLPRPYTKNRAKVDALLETIGLKSRIDLIKPLAAEKYVLKKNYKPEKLIDVQAKVDTLLQPQDTIVIIDGNQTLNELFGSNNSYFIHYLKLFVKTDDASDVEHLEHMLKYHQIALFQFESMDNSSASKVIIRKIFAMLTEHNYVLFKLVPEGIMHVPTEQNIKNNYIDGKYLACAPQYARGWNSFKK